MADEKKKKLSTADILAAARKSDSGESGSSDPPKEPKEAAPEEAAPASAAKESKPAPAAGSGDRPSVSDILAMARQNKGAEEAHAAKPKAKAKPAADKPAKKAPAAAKPGEAVAKDTASILAAARKATKSGPMSKAEAAAKGQPTGEKTAKRKTEVPPMPAKPAYAKGAPAKQTVQIERRGIITGILFGSFLAMGMSSIAATMGLWTLGFARFMFPNILTEPPSRFKVGFPGDFPPGVVETKFKAQFGVWVINSDYEGEQQIFALKTVCTHLGCTPNWLEAEQKFKCPCHGSGFYIDGINFEGPAPRPLERYAISIADDGQLEVDKSKKFQEEMGQWADPSCFVLV